MLPAAVAAALSGLIGAIGADSRWLVALGRTIVHTASIPGRVPYASADTHGWPNVPALAETTFYGLHWAFGDRGLSSRGPGHAPLRRRLGSVGPLRAAGR